jgi:O-antigen/teichoic acid export membrane protein
MWRSIFGNFGVRVLSALLNLGLVILFSQLTGAVGKGEQSLLLTSIAILTIFDSLVGGAALVYLSSRFAWLGLLGASYIWIVFVSCTAFLSLWLMDIFPMTYLVHVVVLSAMSAAGSVHSALLLGQQRLKIYNLIALSIPLLTFLTCAAQWYFQGVLKYEVALYVAYFSSLIISVIGLIKFFPKEQKTGSTWLAIWKNMFALGFYNQLAHVLQLLSFRASYYILEQYKGEAAVGVFSNASSITESIWLIATSISLWQYAVISNAQDQHYTIQLTEKLTRFGMLAALLGVLFFLFLPSAFYELVFGPDFGGLQALMWALAPGVWMFTYALVVGHYFSGHGRYAVNALASGVGLVLSLLASLLLIPVYGAVGAAVAASISYTATSIVVLRYFLKDGATFSLFPRKAELIQLFTQMRMSWRKSSYE